MRSLIASLPAHSDPTHCTLLLSCYTSRDDGHCAPPKCWKKTRGHVYLLGKIKFKLLPVTKDSGLIEFSILRLGFMQSPH